MDESAQTIMRQAEQGEAIAKVLMLRKSRTDKGCYVTTWGTKTPFGLAEVIKRLAGEIERGEKITAY